ncbi:hypothetical protein ACFFLM_21340 [Deinococcus oregonensis]|uniref:Uncharacterized protein n=1 Tax=Deinococcus oregonensis TaxID=1805970 RepID=A0ABV6B6G8_9DEIO
MAAKKKGKKQGVSPVGVALGVAAVGALAVAVNPESAFMLLLVPAEGVYLLRKRLGLLPPVKVDPNAPPLVRIDGPPIRNY